MSQVLRIKEVCAKTGLGRSTIYAWIKDPAIAFPAPTKLGRKASGWEEDKVDAWLARRQVGDQERTAVAPHETAQHHSSQLPQRDVSDERLAYVVAEMEACQTRLDAHEAAIRESLDQWEQD